MDLEQFKSEREEIEKELWALASAPRDKENYHERVLAMRNVCGRFSKLEDFVRAHSHSQRLSFFERRANSQRISGYEERKFQDLKTLYQFVTRSRSEFMAMSLVDMMENSSVGVVVVQRPTEDSDQF